MLKLNRLSLFTNSVVLNKYKGYLNNASAQYLIKRMALASLNTMKPPNVLVFTDNKYFQKVSENLQKCLHLDKYVIYPLKQNEVLTTPWKESAALLVVYWERTDSKITEQFLDYLKKGGKILIICSHVPFSTLCTIKEIKEDLIKVRYKDTEGLLYSGKYVYSWNDKSIVLVPHENEKCAAILKTSVEKGVIITCGVHLFLNSSIISSELENCDALKDYEQRSLPILSYLLTEQLGLEGSTSKLPSPSPGYVFVEKEMHLTEMMDRLKLSEITLGNIPKEVSQSPVFKVPLLKHSQNIESSAFDKECYFSALKTSYFGKTVVFFPVVTSTMYPAEQLSHLPGVVVIANRQLTGKGTRDNVWISPEGSAAFTLNFSLMLSSRLGRRLSILQHMASSAVVHALRKLPGYENLEFRLKWPNDIYYRRDQKIGGVLVKTAIQGDVVNISVGIGVNVSNRRPTTCVNSIIDDYNKSVGDTKPKFKIEEVIAKTLTELETLVDEFKNVGPESFLDLYYKYWLHTNQNVTLAEYNKNATVHSIDEYGFLVVQTEDGKKLSLQPDGNRFDLMKNLIISKEL